jgi:ADP-ribose pyrophosphatase YjhB (NUDIX family)
MNLINIASAVITDDYSRILLLHRNDDQSAHWELPGAVVDDDQADESDETQEQACMRGLYDALEVRAKVVAKLGSAEVEVDDTTYRYNWFQVQVVMGELAIADSGTYDDLDYFDIEDMPSLALSDDVLELYPKIYSGDIVVQSGGSTV